MMEMAVWSASTYKVVVIDFGLCYTKNIEVKDIFL